MAEAAAFPLTILVAFYFQDVLWRISLPLAILATLASLHGLYVLLLAKRPQIFGLMFAAYVGGFALSMLPIWFEHPYRYHAHSFWSVPHKLRWILR